MAELAALPWVLLRKGKPAWRFPSRERGQGQYDSLRFNAGRPIADAALFGPGGEAWYCRGNRYAEWHRDDERRRRQPEPEDLEAEENDSIGTAAQEPLPTPLLATEAADRGADVDGRPVEATSEKVQAGVRLTSPEPSSEGGHIPGPAGSLAPAVSLLKETAAPRRCGGCRAELVRRQDERPSIFAKREFCSRSCAIGQRWAKGKIASIDQVAQAKTAPRVKRTASAPPPAPPETPQILAEPGDWRIYFAMGPTKRARSLSEARSRAIASGADYVEIANLDTGQHLMRFRGCWTETRPAGSAPGGWA